MKKLLGFIIFLIGAWQFYRFGGGAFAFAWLGLCLAFLYTCRKLHLRDALKLWIYVFAVLAVLLGGALLLERNWGESAAFIWVILCTIVLMVFQKKLMRRWLPIFYLAQEFDDIVKRASEDLKKSANNENSRS